MFNLSCVGARQLPGGFPSVDGNERFRTPTDVVKHKVNCLYAVYSYFVNRALFLMLVCKLAIHV